MQPSAWRARILPGGLHAAPRELVRRAEQHVAKRTAGYETGEDESPAILIGLWATRAGEVGAKVRGAVAGEEA